MKKETLQRYLLIGIAALLALYVYFSMMLGPLGTAEKRAKSEISRLEPLIRKAEGQIARTRAIAAGDQHADRVKKLQEVIDASVPTGSSIVWLPQRITEVFKTHRLERATVRHLQEQDDPFLPGFKRATWRVEVPEGNFLVFGQALAQLENQEGLAQISQLSVETILAKTEFQRFSFELITTARQ